MICYFDCSSGISGDMILGAMVDAGLPLSKLRRGLASLPLGGYRLNARRVRRGGYSATKVDVVVTSEAGTHGSGARKWKDIEKVIRTSSLSGDIKQRGLSIFRRLFEAEAKVHGQKINRVHLHELGAVDCIIDILGALIGIEVLGIDTIYSSPLNVGSGTIKTEHGTLPVPAPATAELLTGIPVYSSDVTFELTTPTGAAIITTLAEGFGPLPHMQVARIGAGAGSKDLRDHPNVLRICIGRQERPPDPSDAGRKGEGDESVTVIETNIDDMNPQVYEYVLERLFKAGALDVFLTQVIMKKGRPGVLMTVLSPPGRREDMADIIFRETTSIGVRFYEVKRRVLRRSIEPFKTKYGKVRIKKAALGNDAVKSIPEYEDCRKIARKFKIPLLEVMRAISSRPE